MPSRNPYTQGGSLEGWKETIGTWAEGNSRVMLVICASLVGSLLRPLGQESGGFHLFGTSSTDKTINDGFIHGEQLITALRSDTFLCLDEISQAEWRTLQIVQRFQLFIEKHGASRFQVLTRGGVMGETCRGRAGFRYENGEGRTIFYFLDEVFKEVGLLIKYKLPQTVADIGGRPRLYAVSIPDEAESRTT